MDSTERNVKAILEAIRSQTDPTDRIRIILLDEYANGLLDGMRQANDAWTFTAARLERPHGVDQGGEYALDKH